MIPTLNVKSNTKKTFKSEKRFPNDLLKSEMSLRIIEKLIKMLASGTGLDSSRRKHKFCNKWRTNWKKQLMRAMSWKAVCENKRLTIKRSKFNHLILYIRKASLATMISSKTMSRQILVRQFITNWLRESLSVLLSIL